MNKKTFSVAMLFLFVTIVWLVIELVWYFGSAYCSSARELILPVLFVVAAVLMVWREYHRKKRKHVEDVKKYL